MHRTTLLFHTELLLALTIIPITSLPAAEPRPGDAAIERSLAQETTALSQNVLAGADSKESWEERRAELRRQYLDMLGLWPLPERTPRSEERRVGKGWGWR